MALTRSSDMFLLHDVILQAILQHQHIYETFEDLRQMPEDIEVELSEGVEGWVWTEGENTIGVVKTRCEEGLWQFWHLAVLPQYQGHGLVKKMLQELEVLARAQNCIAMECTVHFPVAGLLRWYEALGYQVMASNVVVKASGYQMVEMVLRKSLWTMDEVATEV